VNPASNAAVNLASRSPDQEPEPTHLLIEIHQQVARRWATQWVDRLAAAHHAGRLQIELIRLSHCPLLVIDEVGYIPLEPEAANLFFQLVSARYETRLTDRHLEQPFGRRGDSRLGWGVESELILSACRRTDHMRHFQTQSSGTAALIGGRHPPLLSGRWQQ
jgi:hypothetical protein